MISEKNRNPSPPLQLIGSSTENFYQLGLYDKDRHKELLSHIMGLLKTSWPLLDKAIQRTLQTALLPALKRHPEFKRKLEAYSEGLKQSPSTLALAYLIPELMSFIHKLIPQFPVSPLACSSLFAWDEKRDALAHGRLLDFPLHGSFDRQERSILWQCDGGPKMLTFHCAGFPFPSLTTMTENGISFALHQKFGKTFNALGTPIFEMIFQMLQNCASKKEVLSFLKKQNSLTSWGLYMGFKNGDILSAEIEGRELYTSEHKVREGEIIYFCNKRENSKMNREGEVFPYGLYESNEMRSLCFEKKQRKLNLRKGKKGLSGEYLIKLMGRAWEQRDVPSPKWLADPMSPSTIQSVCMIAAREEALVLPGQAPKFFNHEVCEYKNSFSTIKTQRRKIKGKTNSPAYQKGIFHFMQCQVALDLKKPHEAYHHIQLAIEYLEGFPFQKVALFFFLVLQYKNEKQRESLCQLSHEFHALQKDLPPYLCDQCSLFISRLDFILGKKEKVKENSFQSLPLKRIYLFEKKWQEKCPRFLFHKLSKALTIPRLDIFDIFYLYKGGD